MENPYAIEINQKMEDGTPLKVRLEKDAIPFNAAELHEALGRRYINKTSLLM